VIVSTLMLCGLARARPLGVPQGTELAAVSEQPLSEDDSVLRVPTREGVHVPVLVHVPDGPALGVALLFPGGGGHLKLSEAGIARSADNFTVRTRSLFAESGVVAVVVDAPSDHDESLTEFRASAEQAEDIARLAAWAGGVWHAPVWVVGTSRGTVSVADAAARGVAVQGIVLTSSVTAGEHEKVTLFDLPLDQIRVPTLLVHQRRDACPPSPLSGARELSRVLVRAPSVELEVIEGGATPQGSACSPLAAHGFVGLDGEVVDTIVDFIVEHS
jgi:hypothetical protein